MLSCYNGLNGGGSRYQPSPGMRVVNCLETVTAGRGKRLRQRNSGINLETPPLFWERGFLFLTYTSFMIQQSARPMREGGALLLSEVWNS